MAYLEKKIISLCGQAIHRWSLIQHGDRVGLALSGGKDSLSLLWLLHERRRRVPIDYELVAFHVEMGYGTVDLQALRDFCQGLGVEFMVRRTDFGPRAHSPENRKNSPCFFCAMNRRRELFLMCREKGCGKLALAHQQDDLHETFLLNALYAGSISTMLPLQPLFKGQLKIIRPLSLCSSDQLRRFAQRKGFPVQPPCCPSGQDTRRARVGKVLRSFYRENKKVRANLWHALSHAGLATLPGP